MPLLYEIFMITFSLKVSLLSYIKVDMTLFVFFLLGLTLNIIPLRENLALISTTNQDHK